MDDFIVLIFSNVVINILSPKKNQLKRSIFRKTIYFVL
jgi:hypothetical protein